MFTSYHSAPPHTPHVHTCIHMYVRTLYIYCLFSTPVILCLFCTVIVCTIGLHVPIYPVLLYLCVQHGESALQIAVCEGHLDVVKVLVRAYRDCHMESEIGQYYMDLAYDYGHGHVVGYLSSEFPSLKRKVSHHSLH